MRGVSSLGDYLHSPPPERRDGERTKVCFINELFLRAMEDCDRDLETRDNLDFVSVTVRPDTRPQNLPCPSISAPHVRSEEFWNIGHVRLEEGGNVGGD